MNKTLKETLQLALKAVCTLAPQSMSDEKVQDYAIDAIKQALAQPAEHCQWTPEDDDNMPGTYATECGELWSFVEGGPAENNYRFCHGCGKPIEVKEQP